VVKKKGLFGPFLEEAILFFQPAFNHIRAVLGFPLFQRLVITTLGLYDFTGVRILVSL